MDDEENIIHLGDAEEEDYSDEEDAEEENYGNPDNVLAMTIRMDCLLCSIYPLGFYIY